MGILNTTPDSFFEGSRVQTETEVLGRVEKMLKAGVSIIDIGGQSTRPGALNITVTEEISRVIPVIEQVHKNFPEAILSIDTFRATVAKQAFEAGASLINDISAGEADSDMLLTVAGCRVPYIIMHKQGNPQNMQENPLYDDIVLDILTYFTQKVAILNRLGIADIVLDPGFGFGKNLEHNYSLLAGLDAFKIFELPVMVGVSRKSMVQKLLGVNTEKALNGTTALHMVALQKGAKILRVHDVLEAIQCIRIGEALGWY
ncbi:MAG: dihydropteroate synthase [Bacteroidota bacterium]|nr:dihydropteroate synthase [Bacteroidota bacterium]